MKTKNMIGLILLFFPLSTFASFDKDLFYGMRNNEQVMELQEFLSAEKLYSGPITGNFYSLTSEGVKKFQKRENISATGYFGQLTRTKINQILNIKIGTTESIGPENSSDKKQESVSSNETLDLQNLQKKIEELMSQIKLLQQVNMRKSNKESTSSQSFNSQSSNSNFVTLPNGEIVKTDSSGNITTYIENKSSSSSASQGSDQNNIQPTKPKLPVTLLNNSLTVASCSSEQILARFQVATEEDKLSSSNISFKFNAGSQSGNISDITDIILVNQNGTIVAGPKEGVGDKEGSVLFTDTVTFQKGTQIFTLKGRIGNNFTNGQIIYTSIDTNSWNIAVPQETKYTLPFQASEMGVYVTSQKLEKNNSGHFTVKITLTSLTELNFLATRLKNKNNNSLTFTQNATPRSDKKTYDVEFQDIPQGNYTVDMVADTTKFIGVVKTFSTDYLVK